MTRRLMTAGWLFAAMAAGQMMPVTKFLPGEMSGTWWKRMDVVARLKLTPEQQKKIDDVFQQYRVRLIDHTAAVEREEVILEQQMAGDPLDAVKARPQIDKVAEARAQLEKTNSNMLLDMRLLLTKDQWDALKPKVPSPEPKPRKFK